MAQLWQISKHCRHFYPTSTLITRVVPTCCNSRADTTASTAASLHQIQIRTFSQQRGQQGNGGLFKKFIDNVKEGIQKNKEMQENIKKFQEETSKFEEAAPFKAAKEKLKGSEFTDKITEASEKLSSTIKTSSETVSTKLSETYEQAKESDVYKKTQEMGKSAKEAVSEAATKLHEQTEELKKVESIKKVSQGLKTVREDLFDEIAEKSKPYQKPTVLRRRTQKEGEEAIERKRKERVIEANENATGMVLHKDSKWYQHWKDLKENNKIINNLFDLKMKYDESDNLFVRASRVVTDKITDIFRDVFSQSEMAATMAEITKVDPSFNKDSFLHECEFEIIPSVLEAYLQGNLEVLQDWCHEAAFNVLKANIEQLKHSGNRFESKILDIRDVDLVVAKIMEQGPVLIMTFRAQQTMVVRDAKGNIIDGKEDKIENVLYVWAMCRDQSILEHRSAWRVLEFGVQQTEDWV